MHDRLREAAGFELTEGQRCAIDAVLADLVSGRPMDRIVCGDVGSGKTEIALHAALAAVASGRQVALLAPTTLLARQHGDLITERLEAFGASVAVISAEVRPSERDATLDALRDGRTDLVVGTDALLAPNVVMPRLGLLIVDEEHRFGVLHKERLKALAAGLHVLTLTATPIPRTLQQALAPIRQLSMIADVPQGRRPVTTRVVEEGCPDIVDALRAEHARGGVSFCVVPRIKDLAKVADAVRAAGLDVRVAHGRQSARDAGAALEALRRREADVLVATSIIESGIDVSIANTIVIYGADRFGLAQLHQLRGRVGRSSRQAYCLLAVPQDTDGESPARRRLEVIVKASRPGAGFTIAAEDLDMRGGGDLLGEEQSGHMAAVGVEFYRRLLDAAITALLHGEAIDLALAWSPAVDVGVTAALSRDLFKDDVARLQFCWRLGRAETKAALRALLAPLRRRGKPLPAEVLIQANLALIRGLARQAGVHRLVAGPLGVEVLLRDDELLHRLVGRPAHAETIWQRSADGGLVCRAASGADGERLNLVRALLQKLGTARRAFLSTVPRKRKAYRMAKEKPGAPTGGEPERPGDEAPASVPGTGEDVCPKCNGAGRGAEGDCPNCAGTGRITRGIGGG